MVFKCVEMGKSFIKKYVQVMDAITWALSWVMRIVLAVMIVVVFTQVLSRFLHFSAPFLEELARYCNIYLAFLAMAYCMRKDSMVKIDTVQTVAKGIILTMITVISETISLVACIFFLYSGIKLTILGCSQTSHTMAFSMWVVYLIIPICASLAVLNRIAFLWGQKKGEGER